MPERTGERTAVLRRLPDHVVVGPHLHELALVVRWPDDPAKRGVRRDRSDDPQQELRERSGGSRAARSTPARRAGRRGGRVGIPRLPRPGSRRTGSARRPVRSSPRSHRPRSARLGPRAARAAAVRPWSLAISPAKPMKSARSMSAAPRAIADGASSTLRRILIEPSKPNSRSAPRNRTRRAHGQHRHRDQGRGTMPSIGQIAAISSATTAAGGSQVQSAPRTAVRLRGPRFAMRPSRRVRLAKGLQFKPERVRPA